MRLLIVEDSLSVRKILKTLVAPFVDEIVECGDADEAVTLWARTHPDLVLMDINLRGADGIAATGRICLADPQAKVVIVTNYDGGDLREAARRAGAIGYVIKENLLEVLKFFKPRREA